MTIHSKSIAILAVLICMLPTTYRASEFREITPILAPQGVPQGAQISSEYRPVSPAIVEGAVKRLMASWNTELLAQNLAGQFYEKQRLLDVINSTVPRDARIQIVSIETPQTLEQYMQTSRSGLPYLVSRVSVNVSTRVELNDPVSGFLALSGTNRYVFTIQQQVVRS